MLHPVRKVRPSNCKWICSRSSDLDFPYTRIGCKFWDQSRIPCAQSRFFSCSSQRLGQQRSRVKTFSFRLWKALRNTTTQWRPIPIGLGIAFLGVFQLYRIKKHAGESEIGDDGRTDDSSQAREESAGSKAGPL